MSARLIDCISELCLILVELEEAYFSRSQIPRYRFEEIERAEKEIEKGNQYIEDLWKNQKHEIHSLWNEYHYLTKNDHIRYHHDDRDSDHHHHHHHDRDHHDDNDDHHHHDNDDHHDDDDGLSKKVKIGKIFLMLELLHQPPTIITAIILSQLQQLTRALQIYRYTRNRMIINECRFLFKTNSKMEFWDSKILSLLGDNEKILLHGLIHLLTTTEGSGRRQGLGRRHGSCRRGGVSLEKIFIGEDKNKTYDVLYQEDLLWEGDFNIKDDTTTTTTTMMMIKDHHHDRGRDDGPDDGDDDDNNDGCFAWSI